MDFLSLFFKKVTSAINADNYKADVKNAISRIDTEFDKEKPSVRKLESSFKVLKKHKAYSLNFMEGRDFPVIEQRIEKLKARYIALQQAC